MKILCLTSWLASGRWLWDAIPDNTDTVDILSTQNLPPRYAGARRVLGYAGQFGSLGIKALRKMQTYDAVVAWEGNTGLPLALLRQITNTHHPPLIILNFVLRGTMMHRLSRWISYAMRNVARVTCISNREIEHYSAVLSVPKQKFQRLQGPYRALYAQEQENGTRNQYSPYIVAGGHTHRDYKTLFEAVSETGIPLVVNTSPLAVKGLRIPANVQINEYLPYHEYGNLMDGAAFTVLPLHRAEHAAGETFLAQAMSIGKPVIATETYTTAEMIEPGQNGLLVQPYDVSALRSAIHSLINSPEVNSRMGKRAQFDYLTRWSFLATARNVHNLVSAVIAGNRVY